MMYMDNDIFVHEKMRCKSSYPKKKKSL